MVLTLRLKKKYFDKIASGTKRWEFREATPYWEKRLEGKLFSHIHFINGYSKHSPFMKVFYLGMQKRRVKGVTLYAIELGTIFQSSNF